MARVAGAVDPVVIAAHTRLLRLTKGVSVASALDRLRGRRDVVWAVPDYVAHIAGGLIPNDPGSRRPARRLDAAAVELRRGIQRERAGSLGERRRRRRPRG